MSWKMFRADHENFEIEEREVTQQSAKYVHFRNTVHGRVDSEKKVAVAHSWHHSHRKALDYIIRMKAKELNRLIEAETRTRKELGKLRKQYRKQYEKEHPVCLTPPNATQSL